MESDLKRNDTEFHFELMQRFERVFSEMKDLQNTSSANHQNIIALTEKVSPVVEVYETWVKIGKWSRPFFVGVSILIAMVVGLLQIFKKIP